MGASSSPAFPGQVVVVNTSSASFPFIERLTGDRRVVITATDSVAQRFDTIFPEFFIKAFQGEPADIDKNDRISIWEAFSAATGDVRRYYQRRGQLSTERALLDDNGDGVGREAAGKGEDGSLASRVVPRRAAARARRRPTRSSSSCFSGAAAIEAELEELEDPAQLPAPARISAGVRAPDGRARTRRTATSARAIKS